jgi:hypothetical protein
LDPFKYYTPFSNPECFARNEVFRPTEMLRGREKNLVVAVERTEKLLIF